MHSPCGKVAVDLQVLGIGEVKAKLADLLGYGVQVTPQNIQMLKSQIQMICEQHIRVQFRLLDEQGNEV